MCIYINNNTYVDSVCVYYNSSRRSKSSLVTLPKTAYDNTLQIY